MCFNVFAHNRDDHSNNYSFIFNDNKWALSPAYDLTYSNSYNGKHATTINGEGKNPCIADLVAVGIKCDITKNWAEETAYNIKEIVINQLSQYLKKRN